MISAITSPAPSIGQPKGSYTVLDKFHIVDKESDGGVQRDLSILDSVKQYNEEIQVLDPKYSDNITLYGGRVLIRMFKKLPIQNGVIFSPSFKVPKVRPGDYEDVEDKYYYDTIGIIVNKDPNIQGIEKGQVVQVVSSLIQPVPVPGTSDLIIPTEYRHYSYDANNPQDQGYILCYPKDVICTVTL